MPACSRSDRRGVGGIVALVLWIVTMALVFALIQSQAGSGAINAVARTTGLRSVLFAGRAALTEASWTIRNPVDEDSGPLARLAGGSADALDPVITKKLLVDDVSKGVLTISNVECVVKQKPPESDAKKPWFIDLSVRVSCRVSGGFVTRTIRRRHLGWRHVMKVTMGSMKGQVIATNLSIAEEPLLEVAEP